DAAQGPGPGRVEHGLDTSVEPFARLLESLERVESGRLLSAVGIDFLEFRPLLRHRLAVVTELLLSLGEVPLPLRQSALQRLVMRFGVGNRLSQPGLLGFEFLLATLQLVRAGLQVVLLLASVLQFRLRTVESLIDLFSLPVDLVPLGDELLNLLVVCGSL